MAIISFAILTPLSLPLLPSLAFKIQSIPLLVLCLSLNGIGFMIILAPCFILATRTAGLALKTAS